eukprot:1133752-Pelagomonas_calceolata.AAC.1
MERLNKRAPGWGQGHKALFSSYACFLDLKPLNPWIRELFFISMHACMCVCVCSTWFPGSREIP